MDSAELRERFLSFFEAPPRSHTRVPSDSLIPSGDPTVLFTSAGMNQFKDCFLGKRTDLKRAASCQKCLRTGDLDHVGKSPSHHSFFEMLGNFSFGDYFKREAIQWAWEFLTGTLDYAGRPSLTPKLCITPGLPREKLWVSVYEEDTEALQLWKTLGMPEDRIIPKGQADNFWPANAPKEGPNGPCGPCSEIYYDPDGMVQGPNSVEVWNLVFTQFDRQPDGSLKPLPKPNIDTGMGLERLTRVIKGVETDYETDLFTLIMNGISRLRESEKVHAKQALFAKRAIADHMRAIVFLIADGVRPSNESRGYVLRMLIRRAARLGRKILDRQVIKLRLAAGSKGGSDIFLVPLIDAVMTAMVDSPYRDDLFKQRSTIQEVVDHEETQFVETLETGTERVEQLLERLKTERHKIIPGDEAFKLYDTYGFPLEITSDIAAEHGVDIDRAGFERALKAQQERSRAASQFSGGVFVTDALKIRETIQSLPPKDAQFVGYESLTSDAFIKGLWNGTRWVDRAAAGQAVGIVLDRSPFYGEAGGQVGDAGSIEGLHGVADVGRTTWVDETLMHQATVRAGTLAVAETVRAVVEPQRRLSVARSHTAAHLLHWALRKVLGAETVQAGSFVEAERVRFDFSSLKGLREEQRHEVEALVNSRVRLADEVRASQMAIEEARRAGAMALFGEKYGNTVRVVTIGDYSKELCGGTHLLHTGFVGTFLIVGESSIAAGTRRIEALVGEAAAARQHEQQRLLREVAKRLGRPAEEAVAGLEELLEQLKRVERERKSLQGELAKVRAKELVAEGRQIAGVTLVTSTLRHGDRELLAALADAVKGTLQRNGVILLAASDGPARVWLVMAATSDLSRRVHAGELLKAVAPLTQGSGGGRPEFAQAGGKDPSGIPAAMKRAEELVREALENNQ